jgi:hypothetical protein
VGVEPHQSIATIAFSIPFYPPSHAFFWDAIKEIYNKDASLSMHLKKIIYFCAWPAMPGPIERGDLYIRVIVDIGKLYSRNWETPQQLFIEKT